MLNLSVWWRSESSALLLYVKCHEMISSYVITLHAAFDKCSEDYMQIL